MINSLEDSNAWSDLIAELKEISKQLRRLADAKLAEVTGEL